MSQNKQPTVYAGVDVAKKTLQLDWGGASYELSNDASGWARLRQLLGQAPGCQVILEATGGYERGVADMLHARGYALSVVLPKRVRAFAEAKGCLAKSDPIDAKVLRLFGEAIRPERTAAPTPAQRRLQELVTRRSQLVTMKVAEQNQAEHYLNALVQRQSQALTEVLARQIQQCETAIAELLAADASFQARTERLQHVRGVGPIVAATLQAYLPELGTLTPETAAALAGVAPYNCDSGPWKGHRCIRGGRAQVRCALYLAAMAAIRSDPHFKAFHQRLCAAGKVRNVALVAVMRKLIILLNRLLKDPAFTLRHPKGRSPRVPPSPRTPGSGAGEAPAK